MAASTPGFLCAWMTHLQPEPTAQSATFGAVTAASTHAVASVQPGGSVRTFRRCLMTTTTVSAAVHCKKLGDLVRLGMLEEDRLYGDRLVYKPGPTTGCGRSSKRPLRC